MKASSGRLYALRRQSGAAAIEFSLAALPVLLVGLGIVELAQWFFLKQAVSLALLEAGRAGITQHNSPEAIQDAFKRALHPVAPLARSDDWRIEVISPSPLAFQDFADKTLSATSTNGLLVINNDYQSEHHERNIQQGRIEGRGLYSGQTIFEANTLALRLTYGHPPLLPGVAALLRMLPASDGYAGRTLRNGRLPLRQELRLNMQSHPMAWPLTNRGHVVLAEELGPQSSDFSSLDDWRRCVQGMWCVKPAYRHLSDFADQKKPNYSGPRNGPDTSADPGAPHGPSEGETASEHDLSEDSKASQGSNGQSPLEGGIPGPDPVDTGLPGPPDELCGIAMCCLGG